MASLPAYRYLDPETREMTREVLGALSIPELPEAAAWESELPACRVAFNILQSREAYLDHAGTIPIFLDARRSVGLQFVFERPEPAIPLQILQWCARI